MVLRYKVMRTMKEVYRVLGVILGVGKLSVEKMERKKREEQVYWNKNRPIGTGVNDEKKRREKLSKKRLGYEDAPVNLL